MLPLICPASRPSSIASRPASLCVRIPDLKSRKRLRERKAPVIPVESSEHPDDKSLSSPSVLRFESPIQIRDANSALLSGMDRFERKGISSTLPILFVPGSEPSRPPCVARQPRRRLPSLLRQNLAWPWRSACRRTARRVGPSLHRPVLPHRQWSRPADNNG